MGRWTQYDEDSYRLPPGFKRIGYDADTGKYAFKERGGKIYESAPWSEYGPLTPVSGLSRRPSSRSPPSPPPKSHPSRSATVHTTHSSVGRDPCTSSDSSDFNEKPPATKSRSPTTFHDFLLPSSIATSLSDLDSSGASLTSPHVRFVEAARKTALPKMQGVVTQLRKSVTSARRPAGRGGREKEFGGDEGWVKVWLLRSQSTDGFKRIGYDADTGKYTFKDRDGVIYESSPWGRDGTLKPVSKRKKSSPAPVMNTHPSRSGTMPMVPATHSTIGKPTRSVLLSNLSEKAPATGERESDNEMGRLRRDEGVGRIWCKFWENEKRKGF